MSDPVLPSPRPSGWSASPATIGRERELDRLVQAALHPPSVVVVEGEGGVGKSRLLRDLVGHPHLRDRRILSGRCFSAGDPFPLGVLVEALRTLAEDPSRRFSNPVAGALAPLLPELRPLLPEPPGTLGDPLARLHLVARAVRAVLREVGPAVLLLDDFQHADRQTLSVVGSLLADLPPSLSVVLAYRREDVPASSPIPQMTAGIPPSVRRDALTLHPLRPEEVRALAASILHRETVPDAFLRAIIRSTSGLPFAVEEALRFLAERGDLDDEKVFHAPPRRFSEVPSAPRASLFDDVPAPVRDFVLGRLARLSPPTKQLLRAASIPEPPIEEALLREVAALRGPAYAEAVGEAVEAGLLEEIGGGRLQLRHDFGRAAIHRGMPGPEHRRLHARTAEALRSQGLRDASSIAYHYLEARRWPAWLRFGERAADQASSVGNDEWAARMLLELLGTPDLARATRVRLAGKLGPAALNGLAHHEAIEVLRTVVQEPGLRPGVRGELRLWLARLLLQAGAVPEYRHEAEIAAGELRRRPEEAAVAHVLLTVPVLALSHVDDQRRALALLEELLPRIDDPTVRQRLMVDRVTTQLLLADPEGWRACAQVPRGGSSVEERRQELRLDITAGLAALYVGHYRRARALADRVLACGEEPMYLGLACWVEALDIWSRFTLGEWEGLEERVGEAAERHAEVPLAVCHLRFVQGLLTTARRSPAEGERVLAGAFGEARRLASAPLIPTVGGALAWVQLGLGFDQATVDTAVSAAEVLRRSGAWAWGNWFVGGAAPALASVGEPERARRLIEEMERGVAGLDVPAAAPNLRFARGMVALAEGSPRAAAGWLERAERGYRRLPSPYGAALTREVLATTVSEADPSGAADALRGSLHDLQDLGATAEVSRVSRRLRALGVPIPRPWRGGRRGYGRQLSPREREVARLVAEGRTNREIAGALFLSPRTVGHHVSNAMRKIGVSSRAALAVAVSDGTAESDDLPDLVPQQ